jgi:hypothetical protein
MGDRYSQVHRLLGITRVRDKSYGCRRGEGVRESLSWLTHSPLDRALYPYPQVGWVGFLESVSVTALSCSSFKLGGGGGGVLLAQMPRILRCPPALRQAISKDDFIVAYSYVAVVSQCYNNNLLRLSVYFLKVCTVVPVQQFCSCRGVFLSPAPSQRRVDCRLKGATTTFILCFASNQLCCHKHVIQHVTLLFIHILSHIFYYTFYLNKYLN